MTALVKSNNYKIRGNNHTITSPYLYAYFDMNQEVDDSIITDRTGNGYNLLWLTGAGNAVPPIGMRTSDHIQFPSNAIAGDAWQASTVAEFPFFDLTKSSLYVYRTMWTTLPSLEMGIGLCARGNATGDVDAGYQHRIEAGNRPSLALHNGTTSLVGSFLTTAMPINQYVTTIFAWDASTNTATTVASGNTVYLQHQIVNVTGALTLPINTRTSKATLGARGSNYATNVMKDIGIYHMQMYHDNNGGGLPINLGHLCRFLHQNPDMLIPRSLWS